MNNNIFNIPDLTPMYKSVCAFVLEHQGEKGFIHCDREDCDNIYAIAYDFDDAEALEVQVKAVRFYQNKLQVIIDGYNVKYTEDDVRQFNDDAESWYDVQNDDTVYFIPTIFNIAENIQQYV